MATLQDSLTLLKGYYSYMLLSLYTDSLMKQGALPLPPSEVIIPTNAQSAIKLNTKRVVYLLEQIKNSPTSKNVYGYLSYISSLKGMLGVFLDTHNRSLVRRNYLKSTLGSKYEAYIETVRFCRNLLTHQHNIEIAPSRGDIERAKNTLGNTGKRIVNLTFHYKDIFSDAWTGQDTYGFHISINTATLHTKRTLFDIIDEHSLFMLAESLYNLSDHYSKCTTKK